MLRSSRNTFLSRELGQSPWSHWPMWEGELTERPRVWIWPGVSGLPVLGPWARMPGGQKALLVLFTLPLPSLPPLCPVCTHFRHHRVKWKTTWLVGACSSRLLSLAANATSSCPQPCAAALTLRLGRRPARGKDFAQFCLPRGAELTSCRERWETE